MQTNRFTGSSKPKSIKRTGWLLAAVLCLLLCFAVEGGLAEGYPESKHPYDSNSDITWTYTHPEEAYALKITFSEDTEMEKNSDFLYVTGEDGTQQRFTGKILQNGNVYVVGRSFTLRLTSNAHTNKNGFSVSAIELLTQAEYDSIPDKYPETRFAIDKNGMIVDYNGVVANLTVPSTIDGVTVTCIGNSVFSSNSFLTSIQLPDGVTSIGNDVFRNCTKLESIDLPDTLITIGNYAFYSCSKLTYIILPNSVTSIGHSAFYACFALTTVDLPDNLKSIESSMFKSCKVLKDVVWPDSLTSIGAYAFEDCSNLSNVWFPYGVESIGNYAFNRSGISGILRLPESVTSIGTGAFAECSNITGELNLPTRLTYLGPSAFSGCWGISGSVRVPEGITKIPYACFQKCYQLTGITLSKALVSIDGRAFDTCEKLRWIRIYPSVTSINATAFERTAGLVFYLYSSSPAEEFAIANQREYVCLDKCMIIPCNDPTLYVGWDEQFSLDEDGNSIKNVSWSSSNPEVASITKAGIATGLKEGIAYVTALLPDGSSFSKKVVVKVGTDESCFKCFISGGKLVIDDYTGQSERLVIPPTLNGYPVSILNKDAFRFANFQEVYIPACIEKIYSGAFNRCFSLKEFHVQEGSDYYTVDGVLFYEKKSNDNADGKETILVQYPYGRDETSYTVPYGVDTLGALSFEACDLKQIVLPDSLTTICGSALFLSDIEELHLSASISKIESGALAGMQELKVFEVDAENPHFTLDDGIIYSKDMKTLVAYPAGKTDQHYIVPDSVINIAALACSETLFQHITLPEGLEKIGEYAFYAGNLREIYFPKSLKNIEMWSFAYNRRMEKAVIASTIQTIYSGAFLSCGEWADSFAIYFMHQSTDELSIKKESLFGTILPSATIYAYPDTAAAQYAEEEGHAFASLSDLAISLPAVSETGDTFTPTLTAGGYPITLPVTWTSSDHSVLSPGQDDAFAAVSCGGAAVQANVPALNLFESRYAVVRGGLETVLPEAVTAIAEESFAGTSVVEVVCGENVQSIGSRAFADCPDLRLVHLPDNLSSIAQNAFEGSESVSLICAAESVGLQFAQESGLPYVIQ